MNKMRLTMNMLAVLFLFLACGSLAQAQATRTWVSGVGDDANPCSRTAPCKTFAGAISKTAASGEINTLDPGGFGAVTITKSIAIDGRSTGGTAGVLVSGTNGIVINALTTDVVILRGLNIDGVGTGLAGISILAARQVSVEDCVIYNFTQPAINVNTTGSPSLYVKDTKITRGPTGISLTTTVGFPVASLDNVRIEGMSNGVVVNAGAFANLRNCSIFQNGGNGILNNATVNVESCVLSHNGTGLNAATGTQSRLSNVSIFNNATSISAAGTAVVEGFFNNRIFGNTANNGVTHQTAQQ